MTQTQQDTISAQCRGCQGTGVYTGMGERYGMAVVCHTCRGTGEEKIPYVPFTGRQEREDVLRVVSTNPGIALTPDSTQGGVSYQQWLSNPDSVRERGREIREHTCPAWWYQGANHDKYPEWEECIKIGAFSSCPSFAQKEKCWEKFDQEDSEREASETQN